MASEEETRSIKRCCALQCCAGEAGGAGGARGKEAGAAPRDAWAVLWRVCAAELCGTALLVLLSCLPGCAPAPLPAAHGALAAGLVVTVLVQALDHVSGAMFNPTVTLAALVSRRLSAVRAGAMVVAQLCGGAAGALALRALCAGCAGAGAGACVTRPAAALGALRAALLEGALGGCLALINCASWDARNRGLFDSWPLRVGATVAALSLSAGELTGASMNPARSFGPALVQGDFSDHWVYWAGPLCGSLCFTYAYNALWRAAPHHAPRAAADYEQWERARAAHAAHAAHAAPAPARV